MDKKNSLLAFLLCFSVLDGYANGELWVVSDVAPNITIEVLSDTQVRLTNHNLAVGYAVDVYKDGVFQPSYSLTENDLLGLGIFGLVFGTKTKVITLPDASPLTRFRLEIYAKILPEGHPRKEFSRQVALKNMDAAFTGMLTNILNCFGVVQEAPKVAKFASDIVRAGGASDRFLDGDLAGGFNKLATWAASEIGKAGIMTAAQKAGISISAGTSSLIGGMVAVAFTLPTVWDVIVSDPQLYHSITLELRTNEISPSYGIAIYGGYIDPDGECYKDTIPIFDIGDALWFGATVFNRSSVPLFNVSLEASLYGPDDSLVEKSSDGGFNLVWEYSPYYPKYFDLAPYPDPEGGYSAPVGLKPDYPLTVSSTGHQYRGGLYRVETQLLGWYGSDALGSSANYIKILDGQAPGKPELVTGEVVADSIALSWRPPPNTYDISYYLVRRFPNANRTGDVRVFTVEVPERKTPSEKITKVAPYLLDEFVAPGIDYYYEVKIVDWDDLESEWSPLFGPLTITPNVPEEGHDVTIQLYVNEAGVTHSPGQSATGEVWAINRGDNSESGNLQVCLEKSSGEILDSCTFAFSNLTINGSTPRYPFSLSSGSYEGEAQVHSRALVQYDENWSDNEATIPVYFSRNLNPTHSFDAFEHIEITSGETITVVDRRGQQHIIKFIGVADPQGNCITIVIDGEWFDRLCLGDYILGLPWAVIKCAAQYVGTYTYIFDFWWPDNIYTFSAQYLTIPWGGTATFEISRTSGSWYNVEDYTVEFLSGLLPSGWSSSVTTQDYRLVVKVQAAHGSGTINFDGWAHLRRTSELHTIYTDAFKWMRFQTVSSPPETVIASGPEGRVRTSDVTFVWSGSDDTTPTSQLEYAYRLYQCGSPAPEFSPLSSDITKTYYGLGDGCYTFDVKTRDLGGTEDPTPASRDFNIVTNRVPNLPINQYPEPGQTNTSLCPTLVGSSFLDPDFGDVFAESRFQIRTTAGTYDTPVWDSGELTPATNVSQVRERLLEDTEYFWRCRYRDDKGAWSEWSNETSFSTVIIHQCEEYLTLMNCELAYQRRISRTVYEYIFWLRAKNNSLVDLKDVTLCLVAEPNNTTVLDDTVKFSLIKAGMEALTDDTFKIRIDRSIEGSERDVLWEICDCKIEGQLGFNYDSYTDLVELAAFTEAWLGSGEGMGQDLYPDGKIDLLDFAIFAEMWRNKP